MVLDETYGPSPRTQALGFLARLGAAVRDGPLGVTLSAWAEIDAQLAGHPHLRDCLRGGVFARLLASHTPEALVETRPECLPALAAVLAQNTTAEVRSDEEAALEFWRCLQVAETADCPEEMLHEARRRMKRLQPELHALYMRRATGMRGA